jgi:hypothetical protein
LYEKNKKVFFPSRQKPGKRKRTLPVNRAQTLLIKVKKPFFLPTNTLSTPTVVGVGKELVGIW